jgi:hypothetical protein
MVGPGALVSLMRHQFNSAVNGGGVLDVFKASDVDGKLRDEV